MSGIQTELGKACCLKAGKFVSASNISVIKKDGLYPCYGGNGIRGYVEGYTHEGTFPLIGRQGALCGNVNYASGKFHATEHAVVVQPLMDIDIRWLYYKLLAMNLGQYATGAAQPGLAVATLEKLSVLIPERAEQVKAAAMLDQVSDLIAMRKKQLQKLDVLVKSRFFEMFGDPESNPCDWPVKKLEVVVASITAGWSANGEDRPKKAGEKAVLKVSAVTQGFFKPDEHKVIPADMEIKKYVYPQKGDLLFSRANTRELVGATAIIEQDYPELLLPDKLWKVLFTNEMDVYYAKHILSTQAIRKVFSSQSTGTSGSMYNVSADKFRETRIPVPPIMLQREFASFVQQTDKSKSTIQQSLDKLELLKKALMQKYFG